MEPVLGNGVAGDVGCWMEACVARRYITNAGEMNGFLKTRGRLLRAPLPFEKGTIALAPGFAPVIDPQALARHTVASRAVPEGRQPWLERRSLPA